MNRRELKTRSNKIAINFAKYISKKNITPNQISILSILFACFGSIGFIYWSSFDNKFYQISMFTIALIGILGRLLCNLIDGMVAIEGGKSTKDGEIFNDFPDRITDIIIFISFGFGLQSQSALFFGFTASLFAVLTAYVRVLGTSLGTPSYFNGPFAKQHRMGLLNLALFISIILVYFEISPLNILYISLIIINIGSFITIFNRLRLIRKFLLRVNND